MQVTTHCKLAVHACTAVQIRSAPTWRSVRKAMRSDMKAFSLHIGSGGRELLHSGETVRYRRCVGAGWAGSSTHAAEDGRLLSQHLQTKALLLESASPQQQLTSREAGLQPLWQPRPPAPVAVMLRWELARWPRLPHPRSAQAGWQQALLPCHRCRCGRCCRGPHCRHVLPPPLLRCCPQA